MSQDNESTSSYVKAIAIIVKEWDSETIEGKEETDRELLQHIENGLAEDLPEDEQAHLHQMRGAVYMKYGHIDDARYELNQALNMSPAMVNALLLHTTWEGMAETYEKEGDIKQATECLEKGLEELHKYYYDSDERSVVAHAHAEAALMYLKFQGQLGTAFENAEKHAERALEIDNGIPQPHIARALVYQEKEPRERTDTERAIEHFKRYLELTGDPSDEEGAERRELARQQIAELQQELPSKAGELLESLTGMEPWWSGSGWNALVTLKFWFLLVLAGTPVVATIQLLTGAFVPLLASAIFWVATYVVYIYWKEWTSAVTSFQKRLPYSALVLVAWFFAGAAIPRLILGEISFDQMLISLLIGGAGFYGAKLYHEKFRLQEPVNGVTPIIHQISSRLGYGSAGSSVSTAVADRQIKQLLDNEEYSQIDTLIQNDSAKLESLTTYLCDDDGWIRENAAEAFAHIGKDAAGPPSTLERAIPHLLPLLDNTSPQIRAAGVRALVNIAWNWYSWGQMEAIIEPMIQRLIERLQDSELAIREPAAEGVQVVAEYLENRQEGIEQLESAIPYLVDCLHEENLRAYAIWALRAIAHEKPEAVKPYITDVTSMLQVDNEHVMLGAIVTVRYLAEHYPELLSSIQSTLLHLLEDSDWRIQQNVAITVGFLSGNESTELDQILPTLVNLMADNRGIIGKDAASALSRVAKNRPEKLKDYRDDVKSTLEDTDPEVLKEAREVMAVLGIEA